MSKWALIGMGFIAPRHTKAISAIGDELLLTCDVDPAKGADFTDWQEMIKDDRWKEVTHVSICTPNYLHYKMAKAMKGKIVLCEKPLVLDSSQSELLADNVFTVLQLRFHPMVINLKKNLKKGKHEGTLIVRVKRDPGYWDGWKGDEGKSGGILFNLGIHYFDLLIHLFGDEYKIINSYYSDKQAEGNIDFNGNKFNYSIQISETSQGQNRSLEIDGQIVTLSQQDNLSYEDLHIEVFKALKKGEGIRSYEASKSIRLVEKLKNGF